MTAAFITLGAYLTFSTVTSSLFSLVRHFHHAPLYSSFVCMYTCMHTYICVYLYVYIHIFNAYCAKYCFFQLFTPCFPSLQCLTCHHAHYPSCTFRLFYILMSRNSESSSLVIVYIQSFIFCDSVTLF